MSAYVIDRNHIRYLIESAKIKGRTANYGADFQWFHEGKWNKLTDGNASEVGQMLWNENIASVEGRYPDTKEQGEYPGPINEMFIYYHPNMLNFNPKTVDIFKAIHCYEYQSCEHPEWETSSAKAFVDTLSSDTQRTMEGYEEAEWGAPTMPGVRLPA